MINISTDPNPVSQYMSFHSHSWSKAFRPNAMDYNVFHQVSYHQTFFLPTNHRTAIHHQYLISKVLQPNVTDNRIVNNPRRKVWLYIAPLILSICHWLIPRFVTASVCSGGDSQGGVFI